LLPDIGLPVYAGTDPTEYVYVPSTTEKVTVFVNELVWTPLNVTDQPVPVTRPLSVNVTVFVMAVVVVGTTIVLLDKVTSPVRARARPLRWDPESMVTDAYARIVPCTVEVVPIVAELPTCQKTFPACAPFERMTARPEVVVSADATWKTKTPLGLPPPLKVRSPEEIASEEVDLYSPGVRVCPPMFPATLTAQFERPAASLNATVVAALASEAAVLATFLVPE
jgi:hypothetical protein